MHGHGKSESDGVSSRKIGDRRRQITGAAVTRRAALRQLGVLLAGIGAACTPARILLKAYPQEFEENPEAADRALRAFVGTVIPGAPMDDPNLVRVYHAPFFRFAPYAFYFVADLYQRAANMFGVERFDALGVTERTRVIEAGLDADSTTRKLYTGAIFLAQISFYAGVFDDDSGCPLIDFEGRYRLRPLAELRYPNPGEYLAGERTLDGNFS
jgi:hypothetical protein